MDLIRRLFLGQPEPSGLLDESFAAFIREHLDELEVRFAPARWSATRAELKKLEKKRMKEMFG